MDCPYYLYYLNAFYHWTQTNYLPGNARLLYYSLLGLFNEARWPASVQVDNYRLMSMVDTRTERVAISARDKLVDCGFIKYDKGKKGSPNTYYLAEYTRQKVSVSDSETVSESGSVSDSETVSVSVSQKCRHKKTKTKTKMKTNISPPLSPSGGRSGGEDRPAPEAEEPFQAFWRAYPRKIGRAAAQAEWNGLCPDQSLRQAIMEAVERQKRSEQWTQEGARFIPSPARWLRESRWQDELAPVYPEKSYDIDEIAERSSLDVRL